MPLIALLGFATVVLLAMLLLHSYLWFRLVRSTTRPGRLRRRLTLLTVALALLPALAISLRRALPSTRRRPWTGSPTPGSASPSTPSSSSSSSNPSGWWEGSGCAARTGRSSRVGPRAVLGSPPTRSSRVGPGGLRAAATQRLCRSGERHLAAGPSGRTAMCRAVRSGRIALPRTRCPGACSWRGASPSRPAPSRWGRRVPGPISRTPRPSSDGFR
ncbi:hypothetical protein [Blastococcus brunescens]|uniref:Uncharacterized protein n=1 Tax=Blastococcus brunescens TaxID=1564165 RepID=A0ABZ1B292_9ACTN|nr:hypothetical protein [Blastococcus sp. BMG 8361]WRL63856.1 hypothetical protein U6N30_30280 [Blastococcus sp. BMG 8361]